MYINKCLINVKCPSVNCSPTFGPPSMSIFCYVHLCCNMVILEHELVLVHGLSLVYGPVIVLLLEPNHYHYTGLL